MLMRLTLKQMKGLLDTGDCPYVRAIGFLYLRYTCPPKDLWSWFEPYIEDEETFAPSADPDVIMTIGKYLTKLLTDMQYYNTTLPRIPVPIERKIKVLLLLLEEKQRRRKNNINMIENGSFNFANGSKVMAIYADAENEPAWYEAVITSKDNEQVNKYWVTFPEYGNSECVDLGDMKLISDNNSTGNNHDRDKDKSRRKSNSRSRSRSRSRDRRRSRSADKRDGGDRDLMQEVLRSSREASAAVGKNYGHRPASYKGSLSLKLDRHTIRKKSRSRSPVRDRDRDSHRRDNSNSNSNYGRDNRRQPSPPSPVNQRRSDQMSKEQQERLKKLRDTYGDASAK
jgi:pre-mRNA-splicing factor 38B